MDIWSLGCVVLDMLTRGNMQHVNRDGILLDDNLPFPDWLESMQNGGKPFIPASAPDIIYGLCQRCFERDPKDYLTAKELTNFIVKELKYARKAPSTTNTMMSYLSYQIDPDDEEQKFAFEWVKVIGNGGYGMVFSVKAKESDINNRVITRGVKDYSQDKNVLALKVLHNAEFVVEKQTLLLQLEHPAMVKYLAIGRLPLGPNGEPNPQTGVLMEYCEGGTLNALSQSIELSQADILKYLRQIVSAVHYLHERPLPIFHGDIKGENIFLTQNQAICKLGDMENFHILVEGKTNVGGLKAKQGTPIHMSPEMLVYAFGTDDEDQVFPTGIGRASDIWSVGCTVLEMVGRGQFQYKTADGEAMSVDSNKPNKFLRQVTCGAYPDQSDAEARLGSRLSQVLAECLRKNAEERPRVARLVQTVGEWHN
ncbi:putative Mitogen-activated protein kinase kinase kinase 4 [Hypsibius exemplaris]|uniref:Mitogen-activated protein kinase kinase kinase 4 n=1 Tax=Hypsibius exemplaris TaxID=2072580 RepID=A0A1W0WLS0_HYPEX|nr:putative Mitogen-activated protein kinase kinase kinase 4 [Hypsibius exemplaris]